MSGPRRLGIYVDDVFTQVDQTGGPHLSSDRAFLIFAVEVATHLGGLVIFGRSVSADRPADHHLPADTELVPLPFYPDLTHIGAVLRAVPGTARAMWHGLARVDTVWIFGPHPFALVLVLLAALRRRRVVLGVRQDTLGYYRHRLRSPRWAPFLAFTWSLDRAYRLLAGRIPVTVVGHEVARAYGSERSTVLPMTVTLVREADVVPTLPNRDWTGTIELLTVGRVDQEKNPFLAVDALGALDSRFRLTWVGRGPLEDALAERAAATGLSDRLRLVGYVPFGEQLVELYRNAHMFVHISLTEGVPQVLIEAFASGLPVVATDVGGVARAVENGEAALLVPPRDLDSLVSAIRRLAEHPSERERVARRGLELARTLTVEAEAARVARFLAGTSAQVPSP